MLFKRNKKGAIELSITGIVVLIIAITVLGLILGFVRNYFKQASEQVATPLKEIEENVKRQLESSGETIILSPSEVELKGGDREDVFIGARNLQSSQDDPRVCHLIGVYCLSPFSAEACTDAGDDILVGGFDPENPDGPATSSWFSLIKGDPDIDNLGFFVQKAQLRVPRTVKADTYDMELRLYYDKGLRKCSETTADWEQVDSYRFTLIVK